jgi:hypothetical protein
MSFHIPVNDYSRGDTAGSQTTCSHEGNEIVWGGFSSVDVGNLLDRGEEGG